MDKIKDSFTFLFKEKNWAIKMLIPFALTILFTLPSLFTENQSTNFYNNSYLYSNPNAASIGLLGFLFFALICLLAIPTILISGWYSYESTQSGIQKRPTKAIWEGNFGDKVKKSLKYIVASLIYGLIFASIIIFFVVIFIVLASIFTAGGINSFSSDPSRMFSNTSGAVALLVCLVFCVGAIFIIGLTVLAYLTITPAMLRLVATNSFGEAFRIQDNWNLAMRHKGEFLGLLLVSFCAGFIVGAMGLVLGFFTGLASLMGPIVYVIASFIVSYLTALVSTYYSYFFYPRFSGLVFRDIVKAEPSLSYVQLEEK